MAACKLLARLWQFVAVCLSFSSYFNMGAASASLIQLEAAEMKQNVITVVLIFLHMLSCKKRSEMNN